ncbi:MAG TPA: DUF4389 domain-containing protein [Candidatus Latescibacteria bacterium]|jgi:hypothetical protein|nr:DUF4389 domain-containing protein [Candidatus Latescibacterota bacterium]|tara:strand:- start:706 stop:1002 length:297 start_codon:yes stop_codon:yes gene_type:complete
MKIRPFETTSNILTQQQISTVGLPLVKWLLALPHYVVLFALSIASLVCIVIAWFAILFTGRYPRGLFDFVVLVMRYWLRVVAYAFLLTTDHYPPFAIE